MSDDVRARVTGFARQTVDIHLPVLLGLMAEAGQDPAEQAARASQLVGLLRGAQVAESLTAQGRPIPVQIEGAGQYRQLKINGAMLARVDETALAGALAGPIARLLAISPVSTNLVLQMTDVREMRGLAGQLSRQIEGDVIALTAIQELVAWRLETFEERLYRLVEGLGGWLEAPPLNRGEFVAHISGIPTRWPEWRSLRGQPYLKTWLQSVNDELGRTEWANSTDGLAEMIWESVAISPLSALRQAARNLRSLQTGGDRGHLLEVLAGVLRASDEPISGKLSDWPAYAELLEAWNALWREEDDALGARRRAFPVPNISVYQAPGESMGFGEPENLPWDQPLLCWTLRECDALRDLLGGTETSLARGRAQIRMGRLSPQALDKAAPMIGRPRSATWVLQAPTRVPEIDAGFSQAMDRAFQAILATYRDAFHHLDAGQQKFALKLSRAAYAGYLTSTKPIWKRRLFGVRKKGLHDVYEVYLTALARALEWPVFVDVFEDGGDFSTVAKMPRFTVPAVWYEGREFAPFWLPIETLGEALGQAPIRIRNVAITSDRSEVVWMGDHDIEIAQIEELRTGNLLRTVHEGAMMMTIHEL